MKSLKGHIYLFMIASMLSTSIVYGQKPIIENAENTDTTTTTQQQTAEILATPDTTTGAIISIHHSQAIESMIKKEDNGNLREVKGFRIQIFSGNRGTTSRNKAFEIKNDITEKEPSIDVYVTYTSPFWKVRVGNCATHERAQELRAWMIEHFPQYATETYIVPSTVLIP